MKATKLLWQNMLLTRKLYVIEPKSSAAIAECYNLLSSFLKKTKLMITFATASNISKIPLICKSLYLQKTYYFNDSSLML
jgi:hypothetical protein